MSKNSKTKMCISVKGEYATHDVAISFLEEYGVIKFVSVLDLDFQNEDIALLKDTVLYINNKLLVGHFDFENVKSPKVSFSFTQPFAKEIGFEMNFLSKVLDIIVNTQNTFYPCFQAIVSKELVDINNIELFVLEPLCRA